MTQISSQPDFPGYAKFRRVQEGFRGCKVYVDGQEIKYAVAVDTAAHTVEAMVQDASGGISKDARGNLMRQTFTGSIRVVLANGTEWQGNSI